MGERVIKTITIPLRDEDYAGWLYVQGRWPLTERQWQESLTILDAMRLGLVEPFGDTLLRLAPDAVGEAVTEALADAGRERE